MIERMQDLPENVLGFTASGKVTARDYQDVVIPAVEALFAQQRRVRFLYHVGADFSGFEPGAMWDDALLGFKHLAGWERVAFVTDVEWLRAAVAVFGLAMPGHVREFRNAELARAKEWITEGMAAAEPAAAAGAPTQAPPAAGLVATSLQLSLTVADLPRSAAWYRDVVGFVEGRRIERDGTLRSVAVSAGQVRILLNQDDGARGWDRQKPEGFSVMINTEQDIDQLAAAIRSRGGVLDSEPADMPWGVRMFRIKDPDGFRFVIARPLGH